MIRCAACHTLDAQLLPPVGRGTVEIEELEKAARKQIHEAIQELGHEYKAPLDEVVWRSRGRRAESPKVPDARKRVKVARRWLEHVAHGRWRDLDKHLGGEVTDRLRTAFGVIEDLVEEHREARERHEAVMEAPRFKLKNPDTKRRSAEKRLERARRALESRGTARKVVGAVYGVKPDTVRKRCEREEKRDEDGPPPDHRRVVLAHPAREDAPDLYIDIEKLNELYPGVWDRVTGE